MLAVNERGARIQHTLSLLHLPNDLLVAVAEHVARSCRLRLAHHAMVVLTSICTRLRALLVDTPHLWSAVSAGWKSDDLFACALARARGRPLRVHVPVDEGLPAQHERLSRCLPAALHVSARFKCFRPEDGRPFWDAFRSPACCPRAVSLSFQMKQALELECLRADMCEGLTSLRLHNVDVAGALRLPALRHLDIGHGSYQITSMHDLLMHAPMLGYLRLCNVDLFSPDPACPPILGCAPLAHLQCVVLHGSACAVAAALRLMPNPRSRFVVEVSGANDGWTSSSGSNGWILARMRAFWLEAAGHAAEFPPGSVAPHICNSSAGIAHPIHGGGSAIRFASGSKTGAPALSYSGSVRCTVSGDPLFRRVQSVHLFCGDLDSTTVHRDVDTLPLQTYLELFPEVERMVIQGRGRHARAWIEDAFFRGLEPWLVARCERRRPLRSLEFRDCCAELFGFYRVVHGQLLAEVVSWNVGQAKDEHQGDGEESDEGDDYY